MPEVITVGEILVEMMRKEVDVPLDKVSDFVGPFPSGAPAIFVDAVARLGLSSGIIGGVGRDKFGQCVIDRLNADGVDTGMIVESDTLSTGVAFVTYFSDGSREFIFHMGNSSAGAVDVEDITENYFEDAFSVHINGSSLTMNKNMREACYKAVEIAKEKGLLISLDPNVREELENVDRVREILGPVLSASDVITPNLEEIKKISGEENVEEAAEILLAEGIEIIAVKSGENGCRLYTEDETLNFPGFEVEEVDPTGAGDAFSAGIVVGLSEEMPLQKLGVFANAAGAQAVTRKGPMEGLAGREKIDQMVRG